MLLLLSFALFIANSRPASAAVDLDILSAGGLAVGGVNPNYSTNFGNVNGLGVGLPAVGLSIITTGVAGGVIYSTPYNIKISGLPGIHKAKVEVYLTVNFSQPTILILESCYPSAGCTTGGSFTTISTSGVLPTPIITAPGVGNGTYTGSLGLFVSNSDGAGITAGADTATLRFVATDLNNGKTSAVTLALNPSVNLQTAVQLLLATAPGGLAVTPASDYSMDYGSVNGLGITPGAGLSLVAAGGGVIYATPYLIQPSFSTFTSTTSTLSVYVSIDFAHPVILSLEDSAIGAGPYSAISKTAGAPTLLTAGAASGASYTRYLGLFVSSANGPTAFTGADNATLTYTITVP